MAGRKSVCLCMGGLGGGYLRIEHKAPQDTEAVCHRCCCLMARVCVCECAIRLGMYWGLTPSLCTFYEHVNHKAAPHNKEDCDVSCPSSLQIYCSYPTHYKKKKHNLWKENEWLNTCGTGRVLFLPQTLLCTSRQKKVLGHVRTKISFCKSKHMSRQASKLLQEQVYWQKHDSSPIRQ